MTKPSKFVRDKGKMSVRGRHSEAEIAELATRFRESWRDGQLIKSWLRMHAEELQRLVRHEDWAWVNVGKALTLAGICYQTGRPWSGETIRKEVFKARIPRKSIVCPTDQNSANAPSLLSPYQRKESEQEFQLIRAKVPMAPPPSRMPAIPKAAPQALTKEEVDLIIMGRPDLVPSRWPKPSR
ncbi:MAG TPA: hypothetical protein VHC39_05675 [Rhizomicrobium sp.]|nr:hypothetical protein [Rhizomicrobium sp.]